MSAAHALHLLALAELPARERPVAAVRLASMMSPDDIVGGLLLSMDLALRVETAARGVAETMIRNAQAGTPFHVAEINWPTFVGACLGEILADGINPAKTCGGCAFRRGTAANMSRATVSGAMHCVDESRYVRSGDDPEFCAGDATDFHCHQDLDADGEATRVCRGFAQVLDRDRRASACQPAPDSDAPAVAPAGVSTAAPVGSSRSAANPQTGARP